MTKSATESGRRHLTSINDLTNDEIEEVFDLARRYLNEFGDPKIRHRIARSSNYAAGRVLATLFYEPSTRTRLSFESAMLRLGGSVITSTDPATSSAAKGESLADTVRVVENYADIIVVRHPLDGAVKLASDFASVPVINGGDGAHEHPTQTLCDLFTLLNGQKKNLTGMKVAISGDLKGSRTIHSLVYALARFGAKIIEMPAPGMELPEHVYWRMKNEFRNPPKLRKRKVDKVDALYQTADNPNHLSWISSEEKIGIEEGIKAVYITRFQKERWLGKEHEYPRIDAKFLKERKLSRARLMHPLPRVDELDPALDQSSRAAYFRQASFGVPIRMAIIATLLQLDSRSIPSWRFQFAANVMYDQPRQIGIECANSNCVTRDEIEGRHARNKFYLMNSKPMRLRCYYCETDIVDFVVGNRRRKIYGPPSSEFFASYEGNLHHRKDIVFFADEAKATNAGYLAQGRSQKRVAS